MTLFFSGQLDHAIPGAQQLLLAHLAASMLSSNTKHMYGDQLLLICVARNMEAGVLAPGRAGAYALAPPGFLFYVVYTYGHTVVS